MSQQEQGIYEFDDFQLDIGKGVLLRDCQPVSLQWKTFELLCVFVESKGNLLTRDELMNELWADTFVEENNLSQHIRALRKALGENRNGAKFIETVPRRGYRFVAEVKEIPAPVEKVLVSDSIGETIKPEENQQINFVPEEDDKKTKSKFYENKQLIFAVICLGVISIGASFWWQKRTVSNPNLDPHKAARWLFLDNAQTQKLPGAIHGTISPDGKLVAYVTTVKNKQSLWLRQVATDRAVQIAALDEKKYYGMSFSPDGEYIYFTSPDDEVNFVLYRIPTLGGVPNALVKNIDSSFSLSPDGAQISFVRRDRLQNGCSLIIAKPDGSGERTIGTHQKPRCYGEIAWSPDGKTIAANVGQSDTGDANHELIEISVNGGDEKLISPEKWTSVNHLVWLPDQSGLLLTGRKEKPNNFSRIWQINRATGKVSQLTNDAVNYNWLSLTTDAKRLLVRKSFLNSNLSIAPASSPNDERRLVQAFTRLAWLPNGKIIYSATNDKTLWSVNADGSGQEQLTFNEDVHLNASPDGRYIVTASAQTDALHIWRMNADGTNRIQITNGTGEQHPDISPDNRWVYYHTAGTREPRIWKVSIDGGNPIQVVASRSSHASVSPDGKFLAYFYWTGEKKTDEHIGIFSLEDNRIVKSFNQRVGSFSSSRIYWAADGKSIFYAATTPESVANLWRHSLEDGEPEKFTNFAIDRIFDFEFSHDQSQIAMIRGDWENEIVLINLTD